MLVRQRTDDVLVVRFPDEKILSDAGIDEIRDELLEVTEHARGKILLDFQGVDLMSTSMFAKLIALSMACEARKIALRICNMSDDLQEVVRIAHLGERLRIHGSVEEALAAFQT